MKKKLLILAWLPFFLFLAFPAIAEDSPDRLDLTDVDMWPKLNYEFNLELPEIYKITAKHPDSEIGIAQFFVLSKIGLILAYRYVKDDELYIYGLTEDKNDYTRLSPTSEKEDEILADINQYKTKPSPSRFFKKNTI